MRIAIVTAVVLGAVSGMAAAEPDPWIVFPRAGEGPRDQLKRQLTEEALRHLGDRERRMAALRTRAEAEERQRVVRARLLRLLGGLPEEKTPLRTRVVGGETREGYRYEKIIFESQPGFPVTANVYVPVEGAGPFPAILMPVGHSPEGKEGERTTAIGLARKGFVVLKYDPPGQGERLQYYDPDLRVSRVGGPTEEHSHAGGHTVLLGDSVARYLVWDGIRGIDYLLTRPDVASEHIGVTGCSGGGTLTAYIAALDPRVAAAAPSCYVTTWRRLLEKLGPQDAEQSLPRFLSEGLDIPDYLELMAPRPCLIASTDADFFPLEGAREAFEEARAFYGHFGARDRVEWFVGPGPHGMPRESREAVYAFFLKHLRGGRGDAREAPVVLDPLERILCTPSGQVADSLGAETVFSLNRERARGPRRKDVPADVAGAVREVAGVAVQPGGPPPELMIHRTWWRERRRVDLVSLAVSPGISLTGVLLTPEGPGPHRPVVWMDARQKELVAAPGGDAESWVKQGCLVLVLQPRGTREKVVQTAGLIGDFDLAFHALVVGQTLPGLRTEDVIRAADYLVARPDVRKEGLLAMGQGAAGVYVLQAGVLDRRINRVVTQQAPAALRLAVERPVHRHLFEVAMPGVLTRYDLEDLIRAMAPRAVTVVNPVDLLERALHTPQYRAWVNAPVEVVIRGKRDALALSPP
jgi:dienelactone hydrolase